MNKDGADIIIHELTVEITGYQTEIEMTEFLAEQRKPFGKKAKLTKEEKRRIQSAKNRLKRLEFARRILTEAFYSEEKAKTCDCGGSPWCCGDSSEI